MMNNPTIHESVYLAPGAQVHYDVTLSAGCSVWCNAVIRGDSAPISLGENSNVQDCAVLHASTGLPTIIGRGVTIGHGAIVHGCVMGDNVLVGMGSIILDGAVIGENTIIGAGALVTKNTVIPPGSMVLGSPAKVRRPLTEKEIEDIRESSEIYLRRSAAPEHGF